MFSNLFDTPIINHRAVKRFIRTYAHSDNWHNLDSHQGNFGYGWLHYAFIRNLRPKRVLCIGSRYGFIPAICALACKDNQKGLVDFVDAGLDQRQHDPHHWGGMGVWKQPNIKSYFTPFGLSPFINLHIMTSQQFARQNTTTKWQYVYLDGDHSYQGITGDFTAFWPKLEPGGIMALHDIHTENLSDQIYGVAKFWQQLKKKYPQTFELPGLYGVGIIQK